ncbi:MAG: alginate lyase family protein [Phycisphaeraceae bacterium]
MNTLTLARDERGELRTPDSDAWLQATSVEDAIERWPDRVDAVLDGLDLEHPGLEAVRKAVEAGDRAAAARAVVEYYAGPGRKQWVLDRLGEPSQRHLERADDLLEGRVHKGKATGVVPTRAHGAWDWNYRGPNDYREFAFALNRHQFFSPLLQAYRKTNDDKYAAAFDRIVRDWVVHTVYPGKKQAYVWTWRVLEAGLRMRSWTVAFHGFAESDALTPATRLLMLSSLLEHGPYIKQHHRSRHNHTLMELDGLNRIALALPEFKKSAGWRRYAEREMLEELEHQVYPDGAHDELSSGYHWVSLSSYENFADITRDAGRDVREAYLQRLVEMYDYWVHLARPDGSLPQNNRTDRLNLTQRMLTAAEKYDRPDWRYIVTNAKEGEKPEGLPSYLAPWAGQLVSRSGWDEDAMWSFFDAGPAGQGWVHADKLHLSTTAFGKDFLIDSGRFWYERDKWTNFAHSSDSHNVIAIDGGEQQPKPKGANQPLSESNWAITEAYDFARASHDQFKGFEGQATHTRAVVFVRGKGWVVVDRIETDRPRDLRAMWRFRPERSVEIADAGHVHTADEQGANFTIQPVGPVDWDVKIVEGQEQPYVQGWYTQDSGVGAQPLQRMADADRKRRHLRMGHDAQPGRGRDRAGALARRPR